MKTKSILISTNIINIVVNLVNVFTCWENLTILSMASGLCAAASPFILGKLLSESETN